MAFFVKMLSEKEHKFRAFADGLKADEDYRSMGIELCERVRNHLVGLRTPSFSIASTHYGESVGKHTDVQKPEFDIVMKINNQMPIFTHVLNVWRLSLLEFAQRLDIKPETIRTTLYSVQFTFSNGMEVDLLPAAANMTPEQVVGNIGRDSTQRRFYSSSLVDVQIGFLKEQDAFTHALARISKYWLKSMNFGGKQVSGASTIFELLAVVAALEEKKKKTGWEPNFVDAFYGVIEKVENMDKLKVGFSKRSDGNWETVAAGGQIVPYLVEPSDPYNNLMRGITPDLLEIFCRNGKDMNCRCKSWFAGDCYDPAKLFE